MFKKSILLVNLCLYNEKTSGKVAKKKIPDDKGDCVLQFRFSNVNIHWKCTCDIQQCFFLYKHILTVLNHRDRNLSKQTLLYHVLGFSNPLADIHVNPLQPSSLSWKVAHLCPHEEVYFFSSDNFYYLQVDVLEFPVIKTMNCFMLWRMPRLYS